MERPRDDHRGAVEKRLGLNGGAPEDLAGEARLALARIELPPHGRMDAVRADQHVGGVDDLISGATVGEARSHLVAALLETGQAPAATDILGPNALARGAQHQSRPEEHTY